MPIEKVQDEIVQIKNPDLIYQSEATSKSLIVQNRLAEKIGDDSKNYKIQIYNIKKQGATCLGVTFFDQSGIKLEQNAKNIVNRWRSMIQHILTDSFADIQSLQSVAKKLEQKSTCSLTRDLVSQFKAISEFIRTKHSLFTRISQGSVSNFYPSVKSYFEIYDCYKSVLGVFA